MTAAADNPLRVGIVQMVCADDRSTNLEQAERAIRKAAADGADIVCLPELFLSRYFCQTEDTSRFELAEPVPGPTTAVLAELARSEEVDIIASLFEKRAAGLYHNTAAFISAEKGFVGMYRKMHIPDDPRYYEKYYFAPGDLGFVTFQSHQHSISTLICWDQWYPEAARAAALRGAEVLFYPTAIGWHPAEKEEFGDRQHSAWEVAQRAHAVSNGVYVVAVNRVGFEPAPDGATVTDGIEFWGQSFIAGPDGHVIYRAPADREDVAVVDLDLRRIESQRHGWPFLRDRRVDAYQDVTRRYVD